MTSKMISESITSNIERLDKQIGKLIHELKEDNFMKTPLYFFLVIMEGHFRDIKDLFMILEFDVH